MTYPPREPPATNIVFPDLTLKSKARLGDVIAVGTDFRAGTLLSAYRAGIFPWPHLPEDPEDEEVVAWCSPNPRCIFRLDRELHWSRSLRRTLRAPWVEVTLDTAFSAVIRACSENRDRGTWITPELVDGYENLHDLGWAHSIEVWERSDSERALVGGLYGVAIGGLFAGESMFHRKTDASKIAFARMAEKLKISGFSLFDVQLETPHLKSLGCEKIPRGAYLAALGGALSQKARLA